MLKGYRRRERGTVMIETAIVLPIVVVLFFGITQAALIGWAHLFVTRAAERVARGAVTVASDAPHHYDDAARGDFAPGGPRHRALVGAARLLLAPLSPLLPIPKTSLAGALETSPLAIAGASLDLLPERALLRIATPEGEDRVGPHDIIEVELTYLFPCLVPLAGSLVCRGILALFSDEELDERIDELSPNPPLTRGLFLASPHVVITARSRLPNHGADYFGDEK